MPIETLTIARLVVVVGFAALVLVDYFRGATLKQRAGFALLAAAMSVVLFLGYLPSDLRLSLALLAFVVVNVGGYLYYVEATADS